MAWLPDDFVSRDIDPPETAGADAEISSLLAPPTAPQPLE